MIKQCQAVLPGLSLLPENKAWTRARQETRCHGLRKFNLSVQESKCPWSAMSSARGLHHVLELQEGLVGGLSIALRHLGHHVGANIAAQVELGDSIVDSMVLDCPADATMWPMVALIAV